VIESSKKEDKRVVSPKEKETDKVFE